MTTNTLRLSGKALPAVTTWERFATACVEAQVWANPVWPEEVETAAVALAQQYGFDLYTWKVKEGLHGKESVRKYARRTQEFWVGFAEALGFKWRDASVQAPASEWAITEWAEALGKS